MNAKANCNSCNGGERKKEKEGKEEDHLKDGRTRSKVKIKESCNRPGVAQEV